jgi:hypothetical protein
MNQEYGQISMEFPVLLVQVQHLFTKHGYLNSSHRNPATKTLFLHSTRDSAYFLMTISALYPLSMNYSNLYKRDCSRQEKKA